MNWNAFNPHNDSYEDAFEAFCIQIFEHHLRRFYKNELSEFFAISGAGGDGGVEAYGVVQNGTIGLQAKWFRTALTAGQIGNIKASILTALKIRPEIIEYIICLPKKINAKKGTKGKKTTANDEQQRIAAMEATVKKTYPDIKITWWFSNQLLEQLENPDCQFIEPYWFGKNFLTLEKLRSKFSNQKKHAWLKARYVPDLNAEGVIASHYDELCLGDDFKEDLNLKLDKLSMQLNQAEDLIKHYIPTLEDDEQIKQGLENVIISFGEYQANIMLLKDAIEKNKEEVQLRALPEYGVWNIKLALDHNRPTNIQRPLIKKLSHALDEIHKIHVTQYLTALSDHLKRKIKILFGGPGTGKTQGLAFCTSKHLADNQPALILPAKGTPCNNWTQILSAALEYPERNADELFIALEALAILEMRRLALEAPNKKKTAIVLIAVDGLEEDVNHWLNWYDRINDTENLVKEYPRLRFLFSARGYFNDHERLSEDVPFEQVILPDDGDVSVWDAAQIYFSPQHFNIRNVSESVMARIESLYALKLFSELYQGKDLATREDVHTDLRSLLIKKINVLDEEFKNISDRSFSHSSAPVSDVLTVIANQFYNKNRLERTALLEILTKEILSLTYSELEHMLDFLADRAVLTAGHVAVDDIIKTHETIYYVSYQSIIEHVITENIYKSIIEGRINHIPEIIISGLVAPRSTPRIDPEAIFPNETIIEAILKRVFLKTGKLVGENGYLSNNLESNSIPGLQMVVLAVAGESLGQQYDALVTQWLQLGHWHQQNLFTRLIRPATKLRTYFNAMWLHRKLVAIPTVFERDKFLWADRRQRNEDSYTGLESAIYPFTNYDTSLYPFDTFDQEPLIYAWCLSSPNRSFRREIRSSLLNWANLNITEWTKLLSLMIERDDTQILEDLASVTLGLAHTLKKADDIKIIADWAIEHIFKNRDRFVSSRIREGFRAIVEKAFENGALTSEVVQNARPLHFDHIKFIQLAKGVLSKGGEQHYPIISDLAWYVIDDGYKAFLEDSYNAEVFKEEDDHGIHFLKNYAVKYNMDNLSPHIWACGAAIQWIREKFGFKDTTGTMAHLPSHGEKGIIMYFAEKYVWQSVYYLQGYLSEHLKLAQHNHFVESYSALTNLPNPSEGIMHNGNLLKDYYDFSPPAWVIPENLVQTVALNSSLTENIQNEIDGEPHLNLPLWLSHRDDNGKEWTHLYNEVMLEDKNSVVYGRLTANAILIRPSEFTNLLEVIKESPKDIYFTSGLDTLFAHTSGSFYQNPSDIVANKFLAENGSTTELVIDDEDCWLNHSIIKVIKSDNNDELYYFLPTKLVREITGIEQLKGKRLKDKDDQTIGFVTNTEDRETKDEQKLTCILADKIDSGIETSSYKMIWFVEIFKRTTLKTEEAGFFLRRTRKHLVWEENNSYQTVKFWDKESS
jgi:hypothetical protein